MDMIDISMVISPEMPTYKGITERKPIIEVTNTIDQGSNESRLSILHHTGTHVDAPFHMLSQGKLSIFILYNTLKERLSY